MKEDKWKQFIDQNQSDFDTDLPSDNLWDKIDKELEGKQKKSNTWVWMVAASVALILTITFFNKQVSGNGNETPVVVEKEDSITNIVTVTLDEESKEIESYYASQVESKITELKQYPEAEELLEEVAELKEEFELLKEEMGTGVDRSVVLEAMIENYRLRLLILEDLLEAVKEPQS